MVGMLLESVIDSESELADDESSDGTDHEQATSLNQEPLANTNEDYSETTQASSSAGNLLCRCIIYTCVNMQTVCVVCRLWFVTSGKLPVAERSQSMFKPPSKLEVLKLKHQLNTVTLEYNAIYLLMRIRIVS